MRHLPAILLAASLFACARPSERIATRLIDYGIPETRALCMGKRLERDLTIAQLRELSALVRAYRQNDPTPGRLTSQDLLRVAARVRDPQVPITVGRAAAACGLLY
jgi:hypothetical protein